VSNLIINAVNYSEPDSLIKVALTQVGQYASIAVSDQGPGIPDSEQAKVFERFYRGKNHLGQGSGLGLSITREIAEIHNGTIKLDSQVGKGSTFTLQLPLADVQHPGV
jgi:signal transduction histidine kinase